MVSGIVVIMLLYKVVSVVGVVVEFWQNIGSGGYIIGYVVVMIIIEGICVSEFQICKCYMCSGVVVVFSLVVLNLIFLLVIIGQLIVNLCFVFEVDMYVGLVVVVVFVVREVVQVINFIKQV